MYSISEFKVYYLVVFTEVLSVLVNKPELSTDVCVTLLFVEPRERYNTYVWRSKKVF